MTLKQAKIGQWVFITTVNGTGATRQHLLDMGVIPGAVCKVIKYAPMGDPIQIEISGYELTLRLLQAQNIECTPCSQDVINAFDNDNEKQINKKIQEHPGLGEEGRYHIQNNIPPIPKGTPISFALVGNQNTGKTTLFNALTGSNQHVGNFPGVTVEGKSGLLKARPEVKITDLPGIYSLSPYSPEEIVTRNFILETRPQGIINIVDATNIERNLYLTMQLLELETPMVVALNMMDEVNNNGGAIIVNTLENLLGVPVVPISAAKGQGIEELVHHVLHVARHHEAPQKTDFCLETEDGGAVHRSLHSIMHLIQDHAQKAQIPLRFAASKLLEGDTLVQDALKLDQNELQTIEHIALQMEKERGLDKAACMADMRFDFIKKVCLDTVIKPRQSKEKQRSLLIDKVLTGKWTAIPCFVVIMGLVFFLTFNVIGSFGQGLLESLFDSLTTSLGVFLEKINAPAVISSLLLEGVCTGIGSVVSFLPILIVLFFFLSMLEDLGYMARIAFVMDKLLRKIGLSGRSIVPLLVGFGCTVPAVMAARTLPSARDRKMTILLTPFMSCSAKVPIYAFFCAAFFPRYSGLMMTALYLFGIVLGIVAAFVFRATRFKGSAVPFVMELPNYRIPSLKNVGLLLWEKTKDFLHRAFTIIFCATLIVWFMQTFGVHLQVVEDSKDSILSHISSFLCPIFRVVGFGDWRIVSSLITGFMAKESVVATISVLFGSLDNLLNVLSPLSCLSLLVFCLLYTPCVAACSIIKKEMGLKWGLFVAFGQLFIAWGVAFLIKLIGNTLSFGI